MKLIPKSNWTQIPIVRPSGNGKSAVVDCPICGIGITLAGTYDVLSDGSVNPTVHCPNPNCSFTDDIKLESWK